MATSNGDPKSALLASLTGDPSDGAAPSGERDQDLFGDIPDDTGAEGLFGNISLNDDKEEKPLQSAAAAPTVGMAGAPIVSMGAAPPVPPPAAAPPAAPSLLASSGLLGGDDDDPRGDGLFDAVDEEEERREQEECKRRMEEEQRRLEQERMEQERLRLEKEQQERAAQEARLAQQMQAQQQQQQQQFSPGGFYRNHTPPPAAQQQQQPSYNGNLQYSTSGGTVQTHTLRRPTTTAGMHNATTTSTIRPPSRKITAPSHNVQSPFVEIKVQEPMLVSSHKLFLNAPYWTYQVETSLREGGTWLVRRRFRHVVALEDRLRQECPGSILPPRPDKHATRAIEEASTTQSAEFAIQRAQELQVYLNQLKDHPIACNASTLRLFLSLQDDMGTAWAEVSSNTLTRLGAVGAGAAVQLAETAMPTNKGDYMEDNAELLALASSEELRMGAVTQAVPKLEGSVTLLREHGELSGAVGMELSKLTKEVETTDSELSVPLSVLSSGLLRAGRRQKRLAVELSAAMNVFVTQYKLCKNEKLAFQDRRHALQKCQKERHKADERAQRLLLNPDAREQDRVEREAVMSDELAVDAVREAQEIATVLKEEVNRIAYSRRQEWSNSMKVVASAMKEATSERVAIWESTRESFLQAFPDSAGSVSSGRTA